MFELWGDSMNVNVLTTDSKIMLNIGGKQKLCLKKGNYDFISSRIYALVGTPNESGYALSCLLAGLIDLGKNQIRVDANLLKLSELKEISCYIGCGQQGFFNKKLTVKQQVIKALKESSNPQSFDMIVDKFALTPERLSRKFAYTGNEHWRASIAIAYAARKRIYCSPYIDEQIWDDYLRFQLEIWIRMLRDEDCVVFLPVSGISKLCNLVDEVVNFH